MRYPWSSDLLTCWRKVGQGAGTQASRRGGRGWCGCSGSSAQLPPSPPSPRPARERSTRWLMVSGHADTRTVTWCRNPDTGDTNTRGRGSVAAGGRSCRLSGPQLVSRAQLCRSSG